VSERGGVRSFPTLYEVIHVAKADPQTASFVITLRVVLGGLVGIVRPHCTFTEVVELLFEGNTSCVFAATEAVFFNVAPDRAFT